MPEAKPKSSVQVYDADKLFIAETATALDWSIPKLMALAVKGLRIMCADEESADEAAERMLAKVATPARQPNVRPMSDERLGAVARKGARMAAAARKSARPSAKSDERSDIGSSVAHVDLSPQAPVELEPTS